MNPRALISVSDKTGVVEFARGLVYKGFEIVSTGGTAETLSATGLSVIPASAVTGFPEMMDGRVKTMHPAIMGPILARRQNEDDRVALAKFGFWPIDIVVVNLYPFQRTASDLCSTFDELVEKIDIGGPTMIRAAAKNFRDVLVVISPDDYSSVLDALDELGGPSVAFRFNLAQKAFLHTAEYDKAISNELICHVKVVDGQCMRDDRTFHLGLHDD